MPIYAYKCPACGHAKDVLQKMTAPAPECSDCGKATMEKQLTAAGFQLKGSGWYATDFKDGNKPAANAATPAASSPATDAAPAAAATPAATPTATAATPSAAAAAE